AVVLARRSRAWQRWTIIGTWCLGLALFTVDLGRAAGHMLWVTFAVGGCLAWSMRTASLPAVARLAIFVPESIDERSPVLPAMIPAAIPADDEADGFELPSRAA